MIVTVGFSFRIMKYKFVFWKMEFCNVNVVKFSGKYRTYIILMDDDG